MIGALCQNQEWQRQMKAEQSDSRMMDADELRNAVWAVLSTPNTSADEMVLALRGFLRSGSSEGESDS